MAGRTSADHGRATAEQVRILYGRRTGRRLRAGERRLMETLLPRIEIALPGEGETLDVAALFGGTAREVWLEIGFGAGEHLAYQAVENSDVGLIGCEPYVTGVARLLSAIEKHGLGNVRVLCDDARALLARLPGRSLDRAFILFPDPWPKTRHHKRRIVCQPVLRHLARVMAPAGELRIATDHPGYLAWILEQVRSIDAFEWIARGPSDWRRRPPDWPETRYEEKAVSAGRACAYLCFRRRASAGFGA